MKVNVFIDEATEAWVNEHFEGDVEAYVNDVLRRERENKQKLDALKCAIQEGLDSGVSEVSIEDIWAEAEERYKARHDQVSRIA